MRRKKKCLLAARNGWRRGINEEEICVHSRGLKRGWKMPPWMYLLIKRENILNTLRFKGCQIFDYMKIRKKMWRNNSLSLMRKGKRKGSCVKCLARTEEGKVYSFPIFEG